MSEDTAHGHHFEPTNGAATGPQVQQAGSIPERPVQTPENILEEQVRRVATLSARVETLLTTTHETFSEFVMEAAILFQTLEQFARSIDKEQHDNRPTNSATTQASA